MIPAPPIRAESNLKTIRGKDNRLVWIPLVLVMTAHLIQTTGENLLKGAGLPPKQENCLVLS